jgi:hypothetical protein
VHRKDRQAPVSIPEALTFRTALVGIQSIECAQLSSRRYVAKRLPEPWSLESFSCMLLSRRIDNECEATLQGDKRRALSLTCAKTREEGD